MPKRRLLIVLIFIVESTVILTGCVSPELYKSNTAFENSRKRRVGISTGTNEMTYLGMHSSRYWYTSSSYPNIVYGLPMVQENEIEVAFRSAPFDDKPEGKALFILKSRDNDILTTQDTSYPKTIYVYKTQDHLIFNFATNDRIIKDKKVPYEQGLDSYDAFILGIRRTGYIFTVPVDVASFPFQLAWFICVSSTNGLPMF